MDHGVVARDLVGERRPDLGPEVERARPVRATVDRAAIADHDRRRADRSDRLELTLHVEDRALRRASRLLVLVPREPAAVHDAGSLGEDAHMLAEGPPHELEHGGLPRARPARDHDTAGAVLLVAMTDLQCALPATTLGSAPSGDVGRTSPGPMPNGRVQSGG